MPFFGGRMRCSPHVYDLPRAIIVLPNATGMDAYLYVSGWVWQGEHHAYGMCVLGVGLRGACGGCACLMRKWWLVGGVRRRSTASCTGVSCVPLPLLLLLCMPEVVCAGLVLVLVLVLCGPR